MLVVLLLAQLSPQTALPGSRGSLLLAIGAVGGIAAALALLTVSSTSGSGSTPRRFERLPGPSAPSDRAAVIHEVPQDDGAETGERIDEDRPPA